MLSLSIICPYHRAFASFILKPVYLPVLVCVAFVVLSVAPRSPTHALLFCHTHVSTVSFISLSLSLFARLSSSQEKEQLSAELDAKNRLIRALQEEKTRESGMGSSRVGAVFGTPRQAKQKKSVGARSEPSTPKVIRTPLLDTTNQCHRY
jgi:hypothetical protein